jgi:hypothetical protein
MRIGRVLRISAIVTVVTVCIALLLLSIPVLLVSHYERAIPNQGRVKLLCETDHHALLMACRELMGRVAREELEPGAYPIRYSRRSGVIGSFPQTILNLDPLTICLDTSPLDAPYLDTAAAHEGQFVYVEMVGGRDMPHLGAVAYAEDYSGDIEGDVRLIDGLYYYDDRYATDLRYRRKVDALIRNRPPKR